MLTADRRHYCSEQKGVHVRRSFSTIHQSQEAVSEPLAEIEYIGVPNRPRYRPARDFVRAVLCLLPTATASAEGRSARSSQGSRALEVLVAWSGRPGELVGKAESWARLADTVRRGSNIRSRSRIARAWVTGARQSVFGHDLRARLPLCRPVTLYEELSDAGCTIVPRSPVGPRRTSPRHRIAAARVDTLGIRRLAVDVVLACGC